MNAFFLFASGFAALVYQVLWLRDLSFVFGNSAHAAAVDLAAFFGGLALGAAAGARLAPRVRRPLVAYGALEIVIAAAAGLFLVLLGAYQQIYPSLVQTLGPGSFLLLPAKVLLAFGALALPTIAMGATLPVMVQHASARIAGARVGPWLYGVNTAGATAGAFAAGFYLPPVLGFRGSYLLAIAINVAVGLAAIVIGRGADAGEVPPPTVSTAKRARAAARAAADPKTVLSARLRMPIAAASGVFTIGLEVAWTRMFAQVLDNSVYAFAAILVVVLVAFASASLVASRASWGGTRPMALAALGAAMSIAFQPAAFSAATNGLSQVQAGGWPAYVAAVFQLALLTLAVPAFAAGLLLPLLMRLVEERPGRDVGRLLAVNTAGAIAGALVTSFVLLPAFGLWWTLYAFGAGYLAVAAAVTFDGTRRPLSPVALGAAAAVLCLAAALGRDLPRLQLDESQQERVIASWEGAHGIVAVTEKRSGRLLRLNNSYSLGGTVDRIERERMQAFLPLILHPRPDRVFFLGLGTGITAGEATRHDVKEVVVTELVPEVVTAAYGYFGDWSRGLARDSRIRIEIEDGRQYLASRRDTFDVIVSDLFVPWHAGTGSLYTREHFDQVRRRLAPRGLFAQWLPLYQLTEREFETIARTLLDVFPHVVVWRADFYVGRPVLALLASNEPQQLPSARVRSRVDAFRGDAAHGDGLAALAPFYVGNLSAASGVIPDGPLNTDARPVVEYLAPVAQWAPGGGAWFTGEPFAAFTRRLQAAMPPVRDPYLAGLQPLERRYVEAGPLYFEAIAHSLAGRDEEARRALEATFERLPADIILNGPFMAAEPILR